MLWPFNRFKNPHAPSRGTIEAIYGMIVAQAREPAFYARLNVADTVNGRLDMVILHMWLMLRRLRSAEGGEQLAQALFDHFCTDMDDNLREMGVGDLTVPKRMQAFGEAFYGRSTAYDMAFDAGDEELAGLSSERQPPRRHVDGHHSGRESERTGGKPMRRAIGYGARPCDSKYVRTTSSA